MAFWFTFCLEDNRKTSVYVFIAEIIWLTFDLRIDNPYQANTIGVWKYFIHINIIYIQHYISETYQASTLGILPMFHIFGIGVVTMHTLAVGGKMTTLPGFDPQTFLATLEITKVLNWNEWNLLTLIGMSSENKKNAHI